MLLQESTVCRLNFINGQSLACACPELTLLADTYVHNVSVISPSLALPVDISIPGRDGAEQRGEERESFFKDTPLTPDSCSRSSLLFFRAKIFTLQNALRLRLCYLWKNMYRRKLHGTCVPVCVYLN